MWAIRRLFGCASELGGAGSHKSTSEGRSSKNGSWMPQDRSSFVDSLKTNTMCVWSFKRAQAQFDPEGRFDVRDPLQQKDGRANSHITYPLRGEDVMFCELVQAGMRVPLAPRLTELLQCYQLAPALLTPGSLLQWTSFIKVCKQLHVTYSLNVFRCLFFLRLLGGDFDGFRGRKFALEGPEARARGAEMSWIPMSLLDRGDFEESTHYKKRYFMYRDQVEWEVSPIDRGCPSLNDLSKEDIQCLKVLCKRQKDGKLRKIPWRDLMDRDLSTLELEPGSWNDQATLKSPCESWSGKASSSTRAVPKKVASLTRKRVRITIPEESSSDTSTESEDDSPNEPQEPQRRVLPRRSCRGPVEKAKVVESSESSDEPIFQRRLRRKTRRGSAPSIVHSTDSDIRSAEVSSEINMSSSPIRTWRPGDPPLAVDVGESTSGGVSSPWTEPITTMGTLPQNPLMLLADVSLRDPVVGPSVAQAVVPEDICLSSVSVQHLDAIAARNLENERLKEQVAVLTRQLEKESGSSSATVQDRCRQEVREQVVEQLHRYDPCFPFSDIPAISDLGTSLYPFSKDTVENGNFANPIPSSVPESSSVIYVEDSMTSHTESGNHTGDINGASALPAEFARILNLPENEAGLMFDPTCLFPEGGENIDDLFGAAFPEDPPFEGIEFSTLLPE